jgi:hypothetical protein
MRNSARQKPNPDHPKNRRQMPQKPSKIHENCNLYVPPPTSGTKLQKPTTTPQKPIFGIKISRGNCFRPKQLAIRLTQWNFGINIAPDERISAITQNIGNCGCRNIQKLSRGSAPVIKYSPAIFA